MRLRIGLPDSLSVLRHRDFRLYWSGQAVGLTGFWAQTLAQSWLVLEQTSSAFALGWVNFAASAPTLLLSLLSGATADRLDKRRILLVTRLAGMLLALALGTLVWLEVVQFWHVLLIALALGVVTAYDLPTNQALVPELVERDEIPKAIALHQAVFHGSRLVGPALAGLIIAGVGLAGAFFANGLSFVAVIVSLLLIRSRQAQRSDSGQSQLEAIAEGLRYVRGQPLILIMLGLSALIAACMFPTVAVMLPVYARDVLGVGAEQMGFLMAMSGLGALIGSILLLTVPREQQLRRIVLGAALLVVALSALAWVRWLPLALVVVATLSLGASTTMGLGATIIQQRVDPAFRGRVMGLHTLTFMGVIPFSALVASWAADQVGLPMVIQGSALLYAAGALALLAWLRLGNVRPSLGEPIVRPATPPTSA